MLHLYSRYQEAYGWTIREIDETDMESLLDQMRVLALVDDTASDSKLSYIDDVL